MKTLIILITTLLFSNANADEEHIQDTPYNIVKMYIGHGTPYFLELGSEQCQGCQIMAKTLYAFTQKNPRYHIVYINVSKDRSVAQRLKVQIIPTQIIYDKDGKEVYRHTGKLSFNELSTLFKTYKF